VYRRIESHSRIPPDTTAALSLCNPFKSGMECGIDLEPVPAPTAAFSCPDEIAARADAQMEERSQ
jgi:hypothetical protein